MPSYEYTVTVDTDTREHADEVMRERIYHDEDYGFDYKISHTRSGSDEEDGIPARPRTGCGCGYDLIWVEGEWQHDAAPYLWGDDHDPHPDGPEPTGPAREFWDREDGVD